MGHGHHHHCHHGDISKMSERRLWLAVGANMLLTFGQVAGGIISGSLSLIADALHNFSDAASLFIALIALRIGRRPADEHKTFGYKRAETIAALINLNSLILIGLYLCYEALVRFVDPQPITGMVVIVVAGFALVVDLFTAFLTYRQSKHSMNMHAVFLHNLSDALASVAVIISGVLILFYDWVFVDALLTLLIAGYILWQGIAQMPRVIHLLMDGSPEDINNSDVIGMMQDMEGVENIHHVHIWKLDEQRNALQAHVVLSDIDTIDTVKVMMKQMLLERFNIHHSTLEFEKTKCGDG